MKNLFPLETDWLQDEIWKPLVTPYYDYTGLYSVSNLGRVWAIRKKCIMKQYTTWNGRLEIGLTNPDFIKKERIHRLVAYVFIPNPDNLPQINHKDGNTKNNNVNNLEWVTHSENMLHAYKHGLISKKVGTNSVLSKYSEETIKCLIDDLKDTELSVPELSEKYKVSKGLIHSIQYGNSWSHLSGFHKNMKWQRKNSIEKRAKAIKDSGFNYNRTELVAIEKETNEVFEFQSVKECANFLGVNKCMISKYLKHGVQNKKYNILYKQDYISNLKLDI